MAGNDKKRKRTAGGGGGGGGGKGAAPKGNPFEKQYAKAKYPVLEKRTLKTGGGVCGERRGEEGRGKGERLIGEGNVF